MNNNEGGKGASQAEIARTERGLAEIHREEVVVGGRSETGVLEGEDWEGRRQQRSGLSVWQDVQGHARG